MIYSPLHPHVIQNHWGRWARVGTHDHTSKASYQQKGKKTSKQQKCDAKFCNLQHLHSSTAAGVAEKVPK